VDNSLIDFFILLWVGLKWCESGFEIYRLASIEATTSSAWKSRPMNFVFHRKPDVMFADRIFISLFGLMPLYDK
jgi:hypothetical protein